MFLSPTSLSSISKPNFAAIAQSTSDLYLNPVWKNKRPPYWNSTWHFQFGFRPHERTSTRHVILHLAARFHPNRTTLSGDMMLYRFSRWQPLRTNFTSGFGLADVVLLRRFICISKPNFVVIAQSTLTHSPLRLTS